MAALSISAALQWAVAQLTHVTDTPNLEAEIFLARVLQVERSHFHACPERELSPEKQENFRILVQRRLQGEPVAYIIGQQEFWSLNFIVTPDTLIPRPETELLVELVLEKLSHDEVKIIADLGTGSGTIALALAHENPRWQVHATDRMSAALAVAQLNAKRFNLHNVIFHQGAWCAALPSQKFDAIISNPPYIAENDPQLQTQVLQYEPVSALLAGSDGLSDIRLIIQQAKNFLQPGAYLFVEHGYQQAESVRQLMEKSGYSNVSTYSDLSKKDRVTIGQF